ncbi:MAG: hypothetical protein HY081_05440 [Gammaproteobacteria bacterium]|nr:hypothetical protein [Gammaproteobacteria bacterium]
MRKALTLLSTLITGLGAVMWTGAGQTSDPSLSQRDLPADIASSCINAACQQTQFSRRWVSKTERGDLLVVTDERCVGNACRAWLVEKTANTDSVITLLTFEKNFRLHPGASSYPAIETYAELSTSQGAYSRFEWNGAGYIRTTNRMVYRVDGAECGTSDECHSAASDALKQEHVDRAVKIWENVHGVSWI